VDLAKARRRWALGSTAEWIDDLNEKNRRLEAEVRKLLGAVARTEMERDDARAEARALKSALEARFSWER
jgi:hypothetical protein